MKKYLPKLIANAKKSTCIGLEIKWLYIDNNLVKNFKNENELENTKCREPSK